MEREKFVQLANWISKFVIFTIIILLLAVSINFSPAKSEEPDVSEVWIDHIIWGGPDLAIETNRFKELTQIDPALGGVHPAIGTANSLLAIGEKTYLEIIGPNPDLDPPFGIGAVFAKWETGGFDTFAIFSDDLKKISAQARQAGLIPTDPVPGSRNTLDGQVLSWEIMYFSNHTFDEFVPFAIDWEGGTLHPSKTSPQGVTLVDFQIFHPRSDELQAIYDAFGLAIQVKKSEVPKVVILLDSPNGEIELLTVKE